MKHSITLRSLVSGFLMTAIVSLGLFSAPVAEASCWMGATGPVYVNTITGLDKGGKWGCDPAKPMKTVQGAIDKYVASYSGAWGPFTILVTDARGSGVISVDNSGNAPIVIEPWTASSLNTVFEVEGQNVEITGWVFNSGAGIETTDEIDFLSVYGNHFHAGSYVDLSAGSDHQIEIRSNDFDGADVSASTTDGWFSIYQNNFYGAASGSDVYIAMDAVSGFIDVSGNTFDGAEAVNATDSGSVVFQSNTVFGSTDPANPVDVALSTDSTDLIDMSGNTIEAVRVGAHVVESANVSSSYTGYIENNLIDLSAYPGTPMTYGLQIEAGSSASPSHFESVKSNTIYGVDVAMDFTDAEIMRLEMNNVGGSSAPTGEGVILTASMVDSVADNTFRYIQDDAMVVEGGLVKNILRNTFSNATRGIVAYDMYVIDVIQENFFEELSYGVVLESFEGEYSDWKSGEVAMSSAINPSPTNIEMNDFVGITNQAMALASVTSNRIGDNILVDATSVLYAYNSDISAVETNSMLGLGTSSTYRAVLLDETSMGIFRENVVMDFATGFVAYGDAVIQRIEGNYFAGNSTSFSVADASIVEGVMNNVVDGGSTAIYVDGADGFLINNNTFYAQTGSAVSLRNLRSGGMTVVNNVFTDNGYMPVDADPALITVLDANLYDSRYMGGVFRDWASARTYLLTDLQAMGYELNGHQDYDTGTGLGVALVDPANQDYSLNVDSLAVNRADATYAPAEDVHGTTRPNCVESDRGAVEYVFSDESDSDGDGLCASYENDVTGTDPTVADSDGDGLDDGEEVYTYGIDPSNTDTDGDGYTDFEEVNYGTDPLDSADYPNDWDHDGMDDTWESAYGLDPTDASDAATDLDGDGLTNLEEYQAGTDPTTGDTDGDGMGDAWEVSYSPELDATVNDAADDADGDGYSNWIEHYYSTDPTDASDYPALVDLDGDGLDDSWEDSYSCVDSSVSDASDDDDSDGLTHADEYSYGTDPCNSDTEGDGMDDYWEAVTYAACMDPVTADDADDDDSDSLTNLEEYGYGTSPCSSDTDSDGLGDDWEVTYSCTDAVTADASDDPDADDLTNTEENTAGTDPCDADTDGDGMDDGWEVTYSTDLDPLTDDASDDADSDGYTNLEEYTYDTDPTDASDYPVDTDTDGDGLLDSWEDLYTCTDSTVADASDDDDGDTLTHSDENALGTDPCDNDTDGDGFRDDYEDTEGTDPTDATSKPDLDITFVNYYSTYGYGDSSSWATSSGNYYYSGTLSDTVGGGTTHYVGVEYTSSAVFGLGWDTDEYVGTPTVKECTPSSTSHGPSSAGTCTSMTAATSSGDLSAWSPVSGIYSFSDFEAWYEPASTAGTTYLIMSIDF